MEVYVLDSLFRRTRVYDQFESLIWTERFSDAGDFELSLKSTPDVRNSFTEGTRLAVNESHRVMHVETVEDKTDSEGKNILSVQGRSLETILENRVAKPSLAPLEEEPFWDLIGTPGDIARKIFNDICVLGVLSPYDVIPFVVPGSMFPPDTHPETGLSIRLEQRPESVFSAIQSLCKLYDLGFRLVRNFDTSQLHFDIYSGNNRTTQQSELTPVIFSVGLDNIQSTTEFSSSKEAKNVAYVFHEQGHVVVYGDGVLNDVDGFERRALVVTSSVAVPDPVEDPDFDLEAVLIQQGTEELSKHRTHSIFDGELNQYGDYKYGVDYELGDIVEMRNKDGIITYKRVTEQIFVSDEAGDRSYPTLSMDMFASADTWLAWNTKQTVWADFTTEVWAEM